ncbi:MAG TPA: ABC transporter permease [Opitutaceae bacterium]|jgi:putative ABC transport system permease protein
MNSATRVYLSTMQMSLTSIIAHKLRSFLTVLGVTIGIFSIIAAMTAVSALRSSIESGLSFLGANTFQFAKWPNIQLGGNDWAKYQKRHNITLEQAQRYQSLMEGVGAFVCLKAFNHQAQMVNGIHHTTPSYDLCGTNQYFLNANQYEIATGRNLTDADVALNSPVAVIGSRIVEKCFPTRDPLGQMLIMGGHPYRVVGTLVSKGTSLGDDQDQIGLVPITRFLADNGKENYSVNIATGATSAVAYGDTLDRGIGAMRIARQLGPGKDNDFEVYSNDSLLAAFAKVADAVRAGALVISSIALLAAGVGIMNIMLVSVTERTKEIGVRKSLGAPRNVILTQFLLESIAISLVGGVAGIILGVLVGDVIAMVLKADVIFPTGWAIIGLVVCSLIGVGFGLYPAYRAANMDPIEALRYE